jgi:glycosyltransferase involved in cell wall biosynthesis
VRVLALGWTAGPDDLELLRPALEELGPGWSLDVVGGSGEGGWYRRLAPPAGDVAHWPGLRAGRWDLAVAPLAGDGALAGDQAFLEHAALGLPGVYSDTGPYAAGVRDGDTGLVAGDPDGWAKALRRLAEDPDLRAALAARARATVVAHRLLASQADTHLALLRPRGD